MRLPVCIALAVLFLAATPASGAEFNVIDSAGLTDALATAAINGEHNVIVLAAGTYKGNFEYRNSNDRSLTVRGAAGTTREQVVLDGGGAGRVLGIYAYPRDADEPYGLEVRGLTLQNGDATSDGHPYGGGVGISISRGTIALIDCVIKDCVATEQGGGVFVQNSQDTRVEQCLILDNTVNGIFNKPGRGGGLMLSVPGGTHVIAGCVVAGNSAEHEGGGLWIGFQNSGTRNIVGNTIYGNTAPTGSGIYFYAAYVANVVNNCVWENAPEGAGQIVFRDGYVATRVGYNNNVASVIGDWTESGGNLNLDPGFVNAAEGDFHLFGLSKLRDMGKNDAPGQIAVDHEGNPRISDGNGDGEPVVDIGAFEIYRDLSGTIGSQPVVAGMGFGEKKPKLYLLYEKRPGKLRAAKLKVLTFTDGRLEGLFRKKMAPGTYPIFCRPKGKGALPIPLGSFIVVGPTIGSAKPTEGARGTLVTLEGKYFGTKKPKVYLMDPATRLRKKLRVKRIEMDPVTGYSELDFLVPKVPANKYVLQLKNKIGTDESSYVVTE